MEERNMRVEARITPKVFREFALFDTFRRQKRHRAPLLFALILLAFAAICFSRIGKLDGAGLIGGVLATVGIALPLVYILSYLASVRRTCKKLEQAGSPLAYELLLTAEGVRVKAGGKEKAYPWQKLHSACRLKNSIALYVAERQAYLLPNTGDEGHEAKLWKRITDRLPAQSCLDLRK